MKWATRNNVHLDRVASPWLISRFVDPDAEFIFVEWHQDAHVPPDAIPLALPGAELGPHDKEGTTYSKILRKYAIEDPAAIRIGEIVRLGVDYVLHGFRPDEHDKNGQTAVGLLALAEGIILTNQDDESILRASFPNYDALRAFYQVLDVMTARGMAMPDGSDGRGPSAQF